MAAINDPQAIAFVNQKARPLADALYTALTTAENVLSAWNNGISALIANNANVLQDGASVNGVDAVGGDGRRVLTGADVNSLMTRAQEMLNYKNNGTLAVAAAAPASFNSVVKATVNGKPLV